MNKRHQVKRILALVLILILVIGTIQIIALDGDGRTPASSQNVLTQATTTSPGAITPDFDEPLQTTSPPSIEVTTSPPAIEVTIPESDVTSPPAIDVTSQPAITVSPPAIEPTPGSIIASITHGAQTVSFGVGSRIEVPVLSSHLSGQTVTITEQFNPSTPYEGVVALRLEHGIGLYNAQGQLPGGNTLTWTFDINAIENALLRDQVTGIRWIPDPAIVQNLTGRTYQPLSGTLIYTFAANTSNVTLNPLVRSDLAFSMSGPAGRSHYNAITATTFESITGLTGATLGTLSSNDILAALAGATYLNTATLYDYAVYGEPTMPEIRANANPTGFYPVRPRGTEWTRRMNMDAVIGGTTTILVESVQFTLRYHVDMGVQGIRTVPGSQMTDANSTLPPGATQPMLSYTIVPDPGSIYHVLIHVTLTQPAIGPGAGSALEVFGEITATATQGVSHHPFPVLAGSTIVTPVAGATVDNRVGGATADIRNMSVSTSTILIPHDFVNRLTLSTFPAAQLPSITGDGAIVPLGRFALRNEFTEDLTNQAMRLLFNSPNIGVTSANLPAGSAGIVNLHAWTTTGRMIDDFSGVLPVTLAGGTFTAVNFYSLLAPGEYIVEIYYELNGIVPAERVWAWPGVAGQLFSRDNPFMYMGRVLDINAPRLPTVAIVGEFDPTVTDLRADNRIVENEPNTAANDPTRLRDRAQIATWIPANPSPRFYYLMQTNNLNNVNLVGGQAFRLSFMQFSRGTYFIQAPSAVQGHYVYLRAPQGQMEIDTSSITATWGSYSVAGGTLNMTVTVLPLADTGGDRVYRLAFPDVIIGLWDENLTAYPPLRVYFGIRALPQAPSRSVQLRELVRIVPMNSELRVASPYTSWSSVSTSPFTDHRVGPDTLTAGPPLPHSLNITSAPELVLWLESQVLDSGVLVGASQTYSWATGAGVLNLAPGNDVQLRFNYLNNTGGDAGFVALVPVPKAGEMFPNAATPGLQVEDFAFTLDLLEEVIAPGFTISYATSWTMSSAPGGFVLWGDVSSNPEDIRLIRIEGVGLLDGAEGHIAMNFGVPTDAEGDVDVSYFGQLNRFAARVYASAGGTSAYRNSQPAAVRMWEFTPPTTTPPEPTTPPSTTTPGTTEEPTTPPSTTPPQTKPPTSTTPPPQEMIKNPDRTVVRVGETINWTLHGFHNPAGKAVTNFTIVDMPSRGLNFISGITPAFTNGEGITFEIRYRVYGSTEWHTHVTGLDATQPQIFALPQPGDIYYTHIGLFFGDVPTDFALGDEIVLTFLVTDEAPNNVLINRFLLRYDNIEVEGRSPYEPIVLPPGTLVLPDEPGQQPPLLAVPPISENIPEQAQDGGEPGGLPVEGATGSSENLPPSGSSRVNPRTGDIAAIATSVMGVTGMVAIIGALLVAGKVIRKRK